MMASDLLILIRDVKLDNEFGLAAFMLSLLVLRAPSETLAMRLVADSDFLAEFAPQERKYLAGIRIFKGEPLLLVKFEWRENLPHGCILRRPWLCNENSETARALCPIHMLWPRMAAKIDTHGLLSPSLTAANFNRSLKESMTRAGYQSGAKYSSRCFRRGAAQELELDGSPNGAIKSAGCWRGMGFKSYIDAQVADALKITRLVSKASNSDSDDDPDSPANFPLGESMRKKLRKSPTMGMTHRTIGFRRWVPDPWVFNISDGPLMSARGKHGPFSMDRPLSGAQCSLSLALGGSEFGCLSRIADREIS